MNQRFDENRAELEAHFKERVQAYIELGESPEQANISAREKFGETKAIVRELRSQAVLRSPIPWAIFCAMGYILFTAFTKSAWSGPAFSFVYALYLWKGSQPKTGRRSKR